MTKMKKNLRLELILSFKKTKEEVELAVCKQAIKIFVSNVNITNHLNAQERTGNLSIMADVRNTYIHFNKGNLLQISADVWQLQTVVDLYHP